MTRDDVRGLMGQDGCQLIVGAHHVQQAAVHDDFAARHLQRPDVLSTNYTTKKLFAAVMSKSRQACSPLSETSYRSKVLQSKPRWSVHSSVCQRADPNFCML